MGFVILQQNNAGLNIRQNYDYVYFNVCIFGNKQKDKISWTDW